ncbi:MAG: triose-phosphate isomerase [archaeon]
MKPITIINFKTYKQGKAAIKLAKEIQKINKDIIIGAQASDIYELTKQTKLKVYAQHVDPYKPGRYTGYTIPEAVKKDGAKGTFLNHSEHPLSFWTLRKTIKRCKEVGLKTAVFASTLSKAKRIQWLKPDYIIIEPPELVGGKVSVSKARPQLIYNVYKNLKVPFLVGAGIKTREDVMTAMKLGASGIAVSSAITKARNPGKVLGELMK